MWSPSPCLKKHAESHGAQKCSSLGFYALRRNCQESPKWFGMRLATGHKMKTETQIEEPLTPMDSWDRISAIAPLTPRCHASEVVFTH
jgi:hypothetical protein